MRRQRGVISSSWSNKAQTPDDYRNGNREVASTWIGTRDGSGHVITPFRIDEAFGKSSTAAAMASSGSASSAIT
jgi:hypothetical protein